MLVPKSFTDHVAMKFRLYSGLFFDLPYEYIQLAGTTLPLFTQYCRDELAKGSRPDDIVQSFFETRLGVRDFQSIKDSLFAFIRLCERQIVLFDAVEDAGFLKTRDMDGPGSLHETANRIQAQNLVQETASLLQDLGVRIVLTAHPTQFYTEPVLGIIGELREAIRRDDVHGVNSLLLQLGRTRFKKREKPTPLDEAKAILWFMENVLYEVVPGVHSRLLTLADIQGEEALRHRPLVELGFWPGGDRDGNPNVTATVTRSVCQLLSQSIEGLYLRDLAYLQRRLTFDGIMEGLEAIRVKLAGTNPGYSDDEALLEDLLAVRRHLIGEHQGLFLEELDRLITRVRCFGFHFGVLDLRQDSRVISRAVDHLLAVLDAPGQPVYSTLTQEDRVARLMKVNETTFTGKIQTVLGSLEDPVLRDCLEVFQVAKTPAVHRFIISNTRGAGDLLAARLLALCAGLPPDRLPIDFVPLFETVQDLADAGKTMIELWSNPLYKAHLEQRGQVQHIMVGFSDGTKDGGYLSANWGIYRAKQSLTTLALERGVRLVFFDGRGGPPARGGGNTHKFYRSLGRDIEGRTIHLTIQGQTISSNYGHHHSAVHNLEQLASAALDNTLFPHNEDWHLNSQDSALLDELSTLSNQAYLKLRDHPDFMPYLEHLSPLRYYSQANNSSRPAKRPGSGALTLDDLRAIPFVGAWSQMKLNIPGYYGLGTALETLAQSGQLKRLKELYSGSLYFRTLLENSMQSLSKVQLPLTAWVGKDPRFGPFHSLIVDEAHRTKKLLLQVSGQEELLAEDPLNRASIRMREDLLVPLSVVQQYALIHLRRLGKKETTPSSAAIPTAQDGALLEKLVVKSMAASVNASRNSV